ncbi:hypothetical protein BD413DRAFT_612035 [Trametes elegans]|nr:hypothetical protein BD413DRAFT_612035 [Trametes elegans]
MIADTDVDNTQTAIWLDAPHSHWLIDLDILWRDLQNIRLRNMGHGEFRLLGRDLWEEKWSTGLCWGKGDDPDRERWLKEHFGSMRLESTRPQEYARQSWPKNRMQARKLRRRVLRCPADPLSSASSTCPLFWDGRTQTHGMSSFQRPHPEEAIHTLVDRSGWKTFVLCDGAWPDAPLWEVEVASEHYSELPITSVIGVACTAMRDVYHPGLTEVQYQWLKKVLGEPTWF